MTAANKRPPKSLEELRREAYKFAGLPDEIAAQMAAEETPKHPGEHDEDNQ